MTHKGQNGRLNAEADRIEVHPDLANQLSAIPIGAQAFIADEFSHIGEWQLIVTYLSLGKTGRWSNIAYIISAFIADQLENFDENNTIDAADLDNMRDTLNQIRRILLVKEGHDLPEDAHVEYEEEQLRA